jgi:hypothetical protein
MIEPYIDHLTDFSLWRIEHFIALAGILVTGLVVACGLVWLGRRWIAEVVEREMYLRGDGSVL